jgi:hypothetical protein
VPPSSRTEIRKSSPAGGFEPGDTMTARLPSR